MRSLRATIAATLAALPSASAAAAPLVFDKRWTYDHASSPAVGQTSEIVSFDAATRSLWIVGPKGVDVLDASSGRLLQHIDASAFGEADSVAIHGGLAAVTVAAPTMTDPGSMRFHDTVSRGFSRAVDVGALPTC